MQLLTPKQAADRLSVSTRTIRRLMDDGQIPFVDLSAAGSLRACRRISEAALRTWVYQHRQRARWPRKAK